MTRRATKHIDYGKFDRETEDSDDNDFQLSASPVKKFKKGRKLKEEKAAEKQKDEESQLKNKGRQTRTSNSEKEFQESLIAATKLSKQINTPHKNVCIQIDDSDDEIVSQDENKNLNNKLLVAQEKEEDSIEIVSKEEKEEPDDEIVAMVEKEETFEIRKKKTQPILSSDTDESDIEDPQLISILTDCSKDVKQCTVNTLNADSGKHAREQGSSFYNQSTNSLNYLLDDPLYSVMSAHIQGLKSSNLSQLVYQKQQNFITAERKEVSTGRLRLGLSRNSRVIKPLHQSSTCIASLSR